MSVRIKRHWFKEGGERKPRDSATAIAVVIWKASTNGLQTLRKAKFEVDVGAPFLALLAEFLVLLTAAADRIAYRHDPGEWRQAFTVALVTRLSEIYQENLEQLVGPEATDATGGYRRRFVGLVNTRMAEYAEFDYGEDGPAFGFLRFFGSCAESVMTDADDRRWALDQMMTVQAPEALEIVERGMRGMLGIDPKPKRHAVGGGD
jgi:hypothetical protein